MKKVYWIKQDKKIENGFFTKIISENKIISLETRLYDNNLHEVIEVTKKIGMMITNNPVTKGIVISFFKQILFQEDNYDSKLFKKIR